jgi:hypothetical protein
MHRGQTSRSPGGPAFFSLPGMQKKLAVAASVGAENVRKCCEWGL